jgi:TonB family protein
MQLLSAVLCYILLQSPGGLRKPDRDYDQLGGQAYIVRSEVEWEPGPASKDRSVRRVLNEIAVYDQRGFLLKKLDLMDDCVRAQHVFLENRETTEEAIYWGDSALVDRTDARGVENVVRFKRTFTTDAAGNWASVNEFGPDGNLRDRTDYSYDQRGRLIETKRTDRSKKTLEVCSFKYNAAGQIEEETCARPEGFFLSETSNYRYEVDAHGNWTRRTGKTRTTASNGKTTERALPPRYRQIEYYAPGGSNDSGATGAVDAGKTNSIGSLVGALAKPCSPMVIRKSGGVLQGSAIKRVAPDYPAEASRLRISGPVVVELTVDEQGKVIRTKVISGPPELRDAAEMAANRWEFAPTYLTKMPTKVIGVITFNFNL